MAGDKTAFYNTEKFMRDFNDCIKPFMDMNIRNISIIPKNELHREHDI